MIVPTGFFRTKHRPGSYRISPDLLAQPAFGLHGPYLGCTGPTLAYAPQWILGVGSDSFAPRSLNCMPPRSRCHSTRLDKWPDHVLNGNSSMHNFGERVRCPGASARVKGPAI
jgi:hypothetical protein